MPAVNPSSSRYFFDRITKLEKLVHALAHQQNSTISNAKGQPIINLGLYPQIGTQPSAGYGLQILDPGSGNVGTPIAQFGEQSNGVPSLTLFGANGNPLVVLTPGVGFEQLDPNGTTRAAIGPYTINGTETYSMQIYDATGKIRLQAGDLEGGGDGVAVWDAVGTPMQLLPSYDATVSTQESTTSTTYGDLTTVGPEVTVQVGSSGKVRVTASAFIQIPVQTTQAGGFVGISVDGAAPSGDFVYLFNSVGVAGGYLAGSYSATTILTGLSQGSHTLKLQYRAYASATGADFAERFIVAQGI
ncbi:MAG: hypothetical protein M0Z92_14150 [Actinomycetota bacterium]|nr:hypothetical protein [Actinomycetota bacterium]